MEALAVRLTGGDVAGVAAFGVAYLGGLIAGFGPCVLPMVPAVFGYVTGHVTDAESTHGSTWRRGLALSATFVLGMALLFAGIGAAAGAIGHAIMVGAWAYYAAAGVCAVLGVHMLGLIDIRFDALNRHLPAARPRTRGFTGAFLFGVMFGVVASPCSTPILAAIATIAAARGSAVQGAGLLFVYGLGKGVPLMLLGLASGSLALMKRLSPATGVLTRIGGVALVGAAGYLLWIA